MVQIKKEAANVWEYKIGINTNIANYVLLWKSLSQKFNLVDPFSLGFCFEIEIELDTADE